MRRRQDWAVRISHESETHAQNCFITCTYDEKHLPEDGGLDVEHWKLFAKRLRKRMGKVRYFHCGEYGDTHGRPHYHAILFGVDFRGDRTKWKNRNGHQTFVSDVLQDIWGMGQVEIGNVTWSSASYVAGYCVKKLTGPEGAAEYQRVSRVTGEVYSVRPPYVTMSLKPGIGKAWFERYKDEVFPADYVEINGRKMAVPGYYDKLLEREDPAMLERLKKKRVEFAGEVEPERYKQIEKGYESDYSVYDSRRTHSLSGESGF